MNASASLGAHFDGEGTHFALYSSRAQLVWLCLFDDRGVETSRHELHRNGDDCWRLFLPGCLPGQRYGYRVDGVWAPEEGLRCNPAKLLLDPYARALDGGFHWNEALYDYLQGEEGWVINPADSAPFVPRCVVTDGLPVKATRGPAHPWSETVIYEANVRGYTMCAPGLTEAERGKFRGMSNGQILGHLQSLGVTAVELMPVHTLLDEAFLVEQGRRNLWGYNSIQFFVPDGRFAERDPTTEFMEMVNALHDAGMEVILDVVYNHTAEGDAHGPNLSFRGIDNQAYYRQHLAEPGQYVNDSGCGNTVNADHRRVQDLVVDSLAYFHQDLGVDGFRFDLGTILGRSDAGFDPQHPLLQRIALSPRLASAKLIAEPWDPGPGGYQLGQFPAPFSELNDRFRDTSRAFWKGEDGAMAELAARLHGSADKFEASGRAPTASINFVTNHDGYTLADLVADWPGDERRQRLNLLATLFFAQGAPLLLAGDEFGNSQDGEHNAYDRDDPSGWTDWSGQESDPAFTRQVRELLALRRRLPLLRREGFVHDPEQVGWLRPDSDPKQAEDWSARKAKMLQMAEPGLGRLVLLVNGENQATTFDLPPGHWRLAFSSAETDAPALMDSLELPAYAIALLEESA